MSIFVCIARVWYVFVCLQFIALDGYLESTQETSVSFSLPVDLLDIEFGSEC
jgi:hypothetical protein